MIVKKKTGEVMMIGDQVTYDAYKNNLGSEIQRLNKEIKILSEKLEGLMYEYNQLVDYEISNHIENEENHQKKQVI